MRSRLREEKRRREKMRVERERERELTSTRVEGSSPQEMIMPVSVIPYLVEKCEKTCEVQRSSCQRR